MKRKGVPAQVGLAIAMLLVVALIAAYCLPQEDPEPTTTEPVQEETTSSPSESTCSGGEELPNTGGPRWA